MRRRKLDIAHAHNSAKIIVGLHKILDEFGLEKEQDHQISTLIERIEDHLSSTPDTNEFLLWQIVSTGLHALQAQLKCNEIARGANGDILVERERLSILCSDLRDQLLTYYAKDESNTLLIDNIIKHDNRSLNLNNFISFLQAVPLPLTYWKKIGDSYPFSRDASENESENSITPLVRLIAFIDDAPLVSPQLLQPQLMYSLKFVVRGVVWHKEASHLRLDLLTTYPASDYSVSPFIIQTPEFLEDDEYEGVFAGHIRFGTAQTVLSDSISFVARCGFQLSDSTYSEVPVIGHNQLEFRVMDPQKSGFLSNYRRLDQHVVQLLEDLVNNTPSVRDELGELLPVLEALTNLLGTYAQGAVFKQITKISEREFQANVLRDIRLILGQDVEEHTSQAGGFTDIRYRGVIIELKVEEENGDRGYICQKYTKQATQYAGVEARQVSVLLVLDRTPKNEPPGDIRNDILLVDVPTHGGKDNAKYRIS